MSPVIIYELKARSPVVVSGLYANKRLSKLGLIAELDDAGGQNVAQPFKMRTYFAEKQFGTLLV
jgi:hypothetical protein